MLSARSRTSRPESSPSARRADPRHASARSSSRCRWWPGRPTPRGLRGRERALVGVHGDLAAGRRPGRDQRGDPSRGPLAARGRPGTGRRAGHAAGRDDPAPARRRCVSLAPRPRRPGPRRPRDHHQLDRHVDRHRRREARREHSRLIAAASERLDESLDLDGTVRAAVSIAVPALADICVIDLLEADGNTTRAAISVGDPAHEAVARASRLSLGAGQPWTHGRGDRRRAGRRSSGRIDDHELSRRTKDDRHAGILRQLGARSALAVPLAARGTTLGAIALIRLERPLVQRG